MNKYNRTKHLNIIQLLEEAAFATARLLQEGRVQEVPQLLADSQDAAIALGSHIERLYGMQTQTVATLGQYCNALYQVSVAMDEASLISLAESIEQIQSIYNAEFPEKKEVVFMPYNASMWDSLESVWMAARDDEGCEAYVVPIPYYDRNNDLGFGEFHYEEDRFPEYVPITHYEEFDLELHRPDVIYIHNPYDDCNYVTSVSPGYYSVELKKYTDMLVYIPYFIVDETRDMKKIEHFALTPGVFNADKVIVQSEKVRKLYIEYLVKNIGGIPEEVWKDKIIGLGTPKLDAVLARKKDELIIPEEWKEIIGDKKVVLYNTHLSLLMANKYKAFLKKLRSVINLFKNRDDVVLLWRPHPLMISTAKSMNPAALDEYMDIVNVYRKNKYGIYDDSPDMDRAIGISDAYYGSDSSVLPLYKATGKPVLIHSIYVETEV